MKAILRSARITPKKANLIATMVRGKSVPEALALLERVNKKGARLLAALIESAAANAEHNDAQDRKNLEIRTVTANKAQTLQRGVPIARGKWRPIRKIWSHVEVTLGMVEEETPKTPKTPTTPRSANNGGRASQKPKQSAKSSRSQKIHKGAERRRSSSVSSESSTSSPSS